MKKYLPLVFLFSLLLQSEIISAQATLHTINFETQGAGYDSAGVGFRNNANQYWRRFRASTEGTTHDFTGTASAFEGLFYQAGEDIGGVQSITSTVVNVAGHDNLDVRLLLAAPGTGYETADVINIYYSYNGSTYTLIGSFSGTTTSMSMDNDLDGDGDGTVTLGAAFTEHTFSIPKEGGSLQVRVSANTSSGGEEIAFDNIRVRGTPDVAAPTVTNVTSSTGNGLKGIGTAVSIQVNFNEPVTVTGTPRLLLETGTVDTYATYASGSGTSSLTFNYTVVEGDLNSDLDYASTTALELNGGTIVDPATNAATLTLATPGAANSLGNAKALNIDGVRPTLQSLVVLASNASATLTFSEPVGRNADASGDLRKDPNEIQANLTGGTVTLTNYTIGHSAPSSTLTVNLTLSGTTNGGESLEVKPMAANKVFDAAGNAMLGTATISQLLNDNKAPTVTNITSSTGDGTYGVGSVISIQLTLDEAATVNTGGGTPSFEVETGGSDGTATYVSGSGTTTLTFNYTVASGHASGDLNNKSPLAFNGGTIRDATNNNISTTLPTAAGGLAANQAIVIETTPPSANNVTASNANGTYATGTINIQVTFTEVVNVNTGGGTPSFEVETGAVDGVATYVSGSGTNTLTFDYPIQTGHSSSDLNNKSPISLNGGTIKDAAGNNATLTLPTAGSGLAANKAIVINATNPTVSSVSATTADGSYNAGDLLTITVTFNENVDVATGGGTPQLLLDMDGTDRQATYSGGTGTATLQFTYTIVAGDNKADLDYVATNSLTLNGGTIKKAGNSLDATLTLPTPGAVNSLGANKNIVVDTTDPTVTSVNSITPDGPYSPGQSITVTILFTEAVTVNTGGGTPRILLETGATDRYATYASGTGTNTLSFTYTVQAGDASTDLDYVATNSLELNGGTITDAAGNNSALTLAAPGAANSLGANRAIVIDSTPPTVSNVTATTANGTYILAQTVDVTVQFTEVITVTTGGGTPRILLETGATDRYANYLSGTGTNTLTFRYTIQANDVSPDLDYNGTNSLEFNGGTMTDPAGNAATLTLVAPGAAGSLAANKAIVIDASLPLVTNVTATNANGTYIIGNALTIRVTFNEAVTILGTPRILLETGAIDRYANYSGMFSATEANFTYTVQTGDNTADLNYISTSALDLNTGSIQDLVGNDADLTLPGLAAAGSLGTNKNIVIDGIRPTVFSLNRSVPLNQITNVPTVTFEVVFSESVTGIDATDFVPSQGTINPTVSGSGTTYLVTVNGLSIDATLTLSVPNTATINDAAGNAYNVTYNSGQTYILDYTAPTQATVGPFLPADNSNNNALATNLIIKFNEDVALGTGNIYIYQYYPVIGIPLLETVSVTGPRASFNAGTDELTIDPIANLPQGTRVYIQTDAGIVTDIAGNPFAGISTTTTWNFGLFGPPLFVDYADAYPGAISEFGCVTGLPITITGDFFTGVTSVEFVGAGGSVFATPTIVSETQLTVVVPTYTAGVNFVGGIGTITLHKAPLSTSSTSIGETIQIGPSSAVIGPGTANVHNDVCTSGTLTTSSVKVDIVGGVSTYTVQFASGLGSTSGYTSGNDITAIPTVIGVNNFSLATVQDFNNCTAPSLSGNYPLTLNQRATIEAGGTPPNSGGVQIQGLAGYCLDNGLAITLNAANLVTAPVSTGSSGRQWTTNGTGSFNNNTLTQPIYTVSPFDILANNLKLTMTSTGNAAGCDPIADEVRINFIVNATADPGGVGNVLEVCWDGVTNPVVVNLNGSSGGATGVQWNSVTGTNAQFSNSTFEDPQYTFNASEMTAKEARVTITPTGGTCGGAATPTPLTISLISIPTNSFTSSIANQHVCPNSSNIIYSVNYNTGSTYSWTVPTAGGTNFVGDGLNTILVNWGTTPNAYNIQVVETAANGCTGNPIILPVTLHTNPTIEFNPKINHAQGETQKYRLALLDPTPPPPSDTIPDGTLGTGAYTYFYGNGVIRESNKWWFDSKDLPIADDYVINAEYKDLNGCVSKATATLNVFDNGNTIGNLDVEYCEGDDQVIALNPLLEAGQVLRYMAVYDRDLGRYYYAGYNIEANDYGLLTTGTYDGGPFTFNPAVAASQIDASIPYGFTRDRMSLIIEFYYDPVGCSNCFYSLSQTVTIFKNPVPTFNSGAERFCTNAAPFLLKPGDTSNPNSEFSFSSEYPPGLNVIQENVPNEFKFYPENVPVFDDVVPDTVTIYYDFTVKTPQLLKGCSSRDSTEYLVFKTPDQPILIGAPGNRVCVTDKNNASPVTISNTNGDISYSARWFTDALAQNPINDGITFKPTASQIPAIENNFWAGHTINGCQSNLTNVVFEVLDQINFTVNSNCMHPTGATPVTFTANYGAFVPASSQWTVFRGDSTLLVGPVTSSPLLNVYASTITQPDYYYISHRVVSNNGCPATITKRFVIVPTIDVGGDAFPTYSATFDANRGGWVAKGAAWEYGLAGAQKRYIEGETATDKMWITNTDGLYPANDKSYLYSPCFILDSLTRPMISMKTWVDLVSGFDGVTLQYSIDDDFVEDANKVWTTLGNFDNGIQSGVNWFNADGIQAKPGEQVLNDYGWTGTSSQTEWQESKHVLDDVDTTTAKVLFRFAFASKDGVRVEDGFAVNDVFIGNRTRTVLIESFTNTSNTATDARGNITLAEADSLKTFNPSGLGTELVKINYHVNFPGIDPFNTENNEDPSARALYYGIDMAPRTRLDGQARTDLGPLFSQWGRAEYNIQTLDLAEASIQIDTATVGTELMISGSFSPNIDLPNRTILYVAIVEQDININLPGNEVTNVVTGETQFEYVMKKLLPTAAGEKYTGLVANNPVSFGPYSYQKTMRHFGPADNLAIIVFLQDEQTKQVYQSDIIRNINDPSIVTGTEDAEYEKAIYLYPNPASHEVNIELPAAATKQTPIVLHDAFGRMVYQANFNVGEKNMKVSTASLADGIYMMQIITPQGNKAVRKMMVKH